MKFDWKKSKKEFFSPFSTKKLNTKIKLFNNNEANPILNQLGRLNSTGRR